MEAINQRKAHRIAEMIRRDISELRKSGADIGKEANEVFDMIDDLAVELLTSTPPRNCERFQTKDAAREAFQKLRGHRVWADVSLWDDRDEIEAFLDWLFALGKEGGDR